MASRPPTPGEPWSKRLVSLGTDQVVPLRLQLGAECIEVWLDCDGLHFRQDAVDGEPSSVGHLPWERAIAMSLIPEEWRSLLPSA